MKALALIGLLAGCLSTRAFPCDSDADCSGLDRGRCEPEGVCSEYNPACESLHSYAEHAGALANTCTAPTPIRPLRNACVAGEPWPTLHDECAANVCERVPACCAVMWNEACVALAARLCDVDCAGWIAAANTNEVLVLARVGATEYAERTTLQGLAERVTWLDARDTRPRLAVGSTSNVAVHAASGTDLMPSYAPETTYDNGAGSMIRAITAVDTNADDAVELGLAFDGMAPHLVVAGSAVQAPAISTIAWADYTGDRIPDIAVATPNDYRLMFASDAGYVLGFNNTQTPDGTFSSIGWGDVDGDGLLDLVAIGISIAVHRGLGESISEAATSIHRAPDGSLSTVGAVGDLDGDLRADVIAVPAVDDPGLGDQLAVFSSWNVTTNKFPEPLLLPTSRMHHIVLADLDRDLDLDVIGAVDGGVVWLENTSVIGAVSFAAPRALPAAGRARWFAVSGWPAQ